MRHLGSILVSLIFGAAVYVLTGVGLAELGFANLGATTRSTVIGGGALLVAGLLYAVLVMARLSPLGPVLLGLAYLGMGAWPRLDEPSFRRIVPANVHDIADAGRLPAAAVVGLLAVPLLATIVSPRRWRRYPNRPVRRADEAADEFGTTVGLPPVGAYREPPLYGSTASGYPSAISSGTVTYRAGSASSEATTAFPVSTPPASNPVPPTQRTGSAWPVREDPPDALSIWPPQ